MHLTCLLGASSVYLVSARCGRSNSGIATMRPKRVGSTNMRLMTRMIVALAVTVFAALVLYFVFLDGNRPAHDEVQSADHHIRYSPSSDAERVRHLMRLSE
jgi:hypothetical protein